MLVCVTFGMLRGCAGREISEEEDGMPLMPSSTNVEGGCGAESLCAC